MDLDATDLGLGIFFFQVGQNCSNGQLNFRLLLYKIPVMVDGMLQLLLKNKDRPCEAGHHDKYARSQTEEEVYSAEQGFHVMLFKPP